MARFSIKVYFYNILKLLQATEKPVTMPISKLYIYLEIANNVSS
jgi:hypothetical protein